MRMRDRTYQRAPGEGCHVRSHLFINPGHDHIHANTQTHTHTPCTQSSLAPCRSVRASTIRGTDPALPTKAATVVGLSCSHTTSILSSCTAGACLFVWRARDSRRKHLEGVEGCKCFKLKKKRDSHRRVQGYSSMGNQRN